MPAPHHCITAWFGNYTVSDRKTVQRIVRTAEKISGVSLPSITDMYTTRCIRKANSIVDDPTHPLHTLFTLLPSGKRFQYISPHLFPWGTSLYFRVSVEDAAPFLVSRGCFQPEFFSLFRRYIAPHLFPWGTLLHFRVSMEDAAPFLVSGGCF
ncbi:hypothetical protein QTP70_009202 [Hemibagrus guttatus]|uniref:Uncharacterized protein n=1 Tax=Hemibagrus guttatus TaxID=175788 RepID=A0AAE0RI91_9TELE|nr:hypothetical protein QTP70_009202 [Hemibagrus guttatus]